MGAQLSGRFPRLVGAVLLAAVLLGGLYVVALESGIARIRKVEVVGLTGVKAQRLRAAALQQSTLQVDEQALRNAIGDRPPIRSLQVETSFPDRAKITVDLFLPVAAVGPNGAKGVAVSADGTVLQGVPVAGLPKVEGETLSGATQGREIHDLLRVLAARPSQFNGRIQSAWIDPKRGTVIRLDRGPLVYFGADVEVERKWLALSRVLSDASFRGASYVDVRVPRRPAVGGTSGGVSGGIDPADPSQSLGDAAGDPGSTATDQGTDTSTDPSTDSTDPSATGQ